MWVRDRPYHRRSQVLFRLILVHSPHLAAPPRLSIVLGDAARRREAFRAPLTHPFRDGHESITAGKYKSIRMTPGWKASSNHVHRLLVRAGSLRMSEDQTHNQTGKLTILERYVSNPQHNTGAEMEQTSRPLSACQITTSGNIVENGVDASAHSAMHEEGAALRGQPTPNGHK